MTLQSFYICHRYVYNHYIYNILEIQVLFIWITTIHNFAHFFSMFYIFLIYSIYESFVIFMLLCNYFCNYFMQLFFHIFFILLVVYFSVHIIFISMLSKLSILYLNLYIFVEFVSKKSFPNPLSCCHYPAFSSKRFKV